MSPCVQICRIGDDSLCVGCARTRTEIAVWSSLPDDVALEIMGTLEERRHMRNRSSNDEAG